MSVQVDDYQAFYRHVYAEALEVWKAAVAAPKETSTQLRRVYWYEVGSIDEWDLKDARSQAYLRDRFEADRETKRIYMALAGQKLKGQGQEKVALEAWSMCFADFRDWYARRCESLEKMKTFHYAVRSKTDLIDIFECGHWKVDFLRKTLTEKGVDASLAVDMVALADNYDVALLLTGDADSIPSINYMKTRNKHVGVVEFVSGYPPDVKGKSFSSRLKIAADFVVRIYEMDLVTKSIAKKMAQAPAAQPVAADTQVGGL